ncbi:MAG: HP0268 family nuclease [Helicobacter sp.]|nr:HP0268 family nuclease [Helicobacter sp.]
MPKEAKQNSQNNEDIAIEPKTKAPKSTQKATKKEGKNSKKDDSKIELSHIELALNNYKDSDKENKNPQISIDELLSANDKFFYLDSKNNEKDLQKIVKIIEENAKGAKLNKISFGLDEKDFIYELHII